MTALEKGVAIWAGQNLTVSDKQNEQIIAIFNFQGLLEP